MKIYCDGATSNNGKINAVGGWAYVIIDEKDNIINSDFGKIESATNQQMELKAIIEGCKYALNNIELEETSFDADICKFEVYTDSAYVHNCYKQGWYFNWERNGWKTAKKEPVKNKELWIELINYFEHPYFYFEKVKGHNGDKWNEFIDNLAVQARL